MADKEIASFGSELGGRVQIMVDDATGLVTGLVTPAGKAPLGGGGGSGGTASMSALGSWNLTTNIATAPDGTTTFTPASGVYPTSGANFLVCTGTGTQTLDGHAFIPGDFAVMSPALGAWQRVAGSSGTIAATTKPLIGDGAGSAVAGASNVDYAPPTILAVGVGIFLMPAGTVGSNGALTITGTAFAGGLTDGFWGYFPANALTGSNAAGFYWVVMSSTTAGVVYNTTYAPGGSTAIPAAPTAFSGTTGGAYTNAITTYITLLSVSLGTNPFGKNGFMRHRFTLLGNTVSTTHNTQSRLNGTGVGIQAALNGTNIQLSVLQTVQNRGRTDRQIATFGTTGDIYAGTGGVGTSSVDTSGAVTYSLTTQIGATGDWNGLMAFDIAAYYAP